MKEKIFQNRIFLIILLVVLLIITGFLIYINGDSKENNINEPKEVKEKSLNEADILPQDIKLKEDYIIELDQDLSSINFSDFIENYDELTDKELNVLSNLELDNIDTSKEGEYEFSLSYNGETITSKVIVKKVEDNTKQNEEQVNTDDKNNSSKSNNTSNQNTQNNINQELDDTPQSTPEPTPVQQTLTMPAGTYRDGNFTVVSNGNNTGTVSLNGNTGNIKFECKQEYNGYKWCSIVLDTPTVSNGNVMMVAALVPGSGNYIGSYYFDSNSITMDYSTEDIRDLSWLSRYNVNVTRLSYQASTPTADGREAENVWGTYDKDYSNYDYVMYKTIDYNFKVNGIIVLRGTKLNNGLAGPDAFSWEQIFF